MIVATGQHEMQRPARSWDRLHVTSPYEAVRAQARGRSDAGSDAVEGIACSTAPRTSVLICTVPRSGSWLLAEALEATGVCGHPREYFRPDYQPGYARAWGLDVRCFRDYVDGVRSAGTTPDGTFGAKLHWGQMAPLLERLRADAGAQRAESDAGLIATSFPAPRYVYLSRDDKARQSISLYKAIHLDVWWSFVDDGEELVDARALPLEPDFDEIARLEATLCEHELRWLRFFEQGGVEPVRVRYADLATSYEATVAAVFEALELPLHTRTFVTPRLRRQADEVTDDWERRYLAWRAAA